MSASGLPRVSAYPWADLARIPVASVRRAASVRRRLGAVASLSNVARALGEVLASDVAIALGRVSPSDAPPAESRSIHLETVDGATTVVVEPESALVTAALARFLGRAAGPTAPGATLGPALAGALAALALEVARRSGSTLPLRARSDAAAAGNGLGIDATVLLDGRPYGVAVWACERIAPTGGGSASVDLTDLGALPIRLPLVAALSAGRREDVESLRVGDVWLPGEGWLRGGARVAEGSLVRAALERAALSAPADERGVGTGGSEDGKLVLRGDIVALPADASAALEARGGSIGTMSDGDDTLEDIALGAPVVVRVEVASVTLAAREWAELRAGDVLETGLRLSEPAVLRVAGREVAKGELVSVDGELGVRILEIVREDRGP